MLCHTNKVNFSFFPRRTGDTSTESPVWSLGTELSEEKYIPGKDELKDFNKTNDTLQ